MTYLRLISLVLTATVISVSGQCETNFIEESFSVVNPLDSTKLNGTLSLPDNSAPKAVIVLATGSGLQDRDETLGRHKPFKDLAEYLSSNGYAVARTDDRGYGDPIDTALLKRSTQWDEMSDYRVVMEAMHNRKDLSSLPVGLLGHSLGGSEAIMCFSKASNAGKYNNVGYTPDFIITLAAPAVAGDSLILDQTRQQLRMQGAEYAFDLYKNMLSNRYRWAKSYMPENILRSTLFDDIMKQLPPGTVLTDEMKTMIDSQIDVFCSPAYREMLRYDPTDDIMDVNVPWLALYGTKDIQVSVPLNSDALSKATSGRNNVTITSLQDKNHLFQNAITGSIEEYQSINGAIADDVLQEILEWLEYNFNKQ